MDAENRLHEQVRFRNGIERLKMNSTLVNLHPYLVFLLCMAFLPGAHARGDERNGTALTIYSKAEPGSIDPDNYRPVPGRSPGYRYGGAVPGYAVVRHLQTMTLERGLTTRNFSDVAAYLDPTTVIFRSLTHPETRVVEQNFLFDLVSRDRLLDKFTDKTITVEVAHGDTIESYTGTLLSTDGGLTLREENGGLRVLNRFHNVNLPRLPRGLHTKPTLEWNLWSPETGEQTVEVAYQTGGLTWWADYNFTFIPEDDPNSGLLDVSAWVSIINQSGATYEDAKLKLIAGDVQKVKSRDARRERLSAFSVAAEVAEPPEAFEEKSFFEYHLYTLPRTTTLRNNSTQQMTLFEAVQNVPVEKLLIYNGSGEVPIGNATPFSDSGYGVNAGSGKVDVFLKLKNSEDHGMGKPLPAGRIRVNQRDTDGSLEFIGEDTIDHTPKNEEVMIRLGSAFDVVGERIQTAFQSDRSRKVITESFEIKVKNHKDRAVKVTVLENLYRGKNWEITQSSEPYKKEDSRTISFKLTIPSEEEVTLAYTVRYTW